ncbi:unnamed protein product [Brassica rapa subsp. narinosa]
MTVEAARPAGFFFKSSDYGKGCKLSSRCHQHDFLKTIKKLEASEKSWFEDHPLFKHIFHMDCTPTRKAMGLWMLLLRTMHTGKGRQAWFGVNGVPIRYSIREHSPPLWFILPLISRKLSEHREHEVCEKVF